MSKRIACTMVYEAKKIMTLLSSLNELKQKAKEKFAMTDPEIIKVFYDGAELDDDAFEYLVATKNEINLALEYSGQDFSTEALSCRSVNSIPSGTNAISDDAIKTYNYTIINGKNNSNNTYQISINSLGRLLDLSNTILGREGYNKEKYICSFYSQQGQPLVGFLSAMQYIKCYKVIDDADLLYVIISENPNQGSSVKPASYNRENILNLQSNESKKPYLVIKVNFSLDKIWDVKHILGMQIGIPPNCIKILDHGDDNKPLSDFKLQAYETKELKYSINNTYKLGNNEINTYINQSLEGKSLFRALMICFPHHTKEVFFKFVGCLRYFSNNCVPLLYAIYRVKKLQTIFSTENIAIEEGMIITFRNIFSLLKISVVETKIFEKSLEVFGFILELCKNENFDIEKYEEFKEFPTTCEGTGEVMKNPIKIKKNDNSYAYYDKSYLILIRENNTPIQNVNELPNDLDIDLKFKKCLRRLITNSKNEIVTIESNYDQNLNILDTIFRYDKNINLKLLSEYAKRNKLTTITSYLDFSQHSNKYTLTKNVVGKIFINLGLRECSDDIELLDPISKETKRFTTDSLSLQFVNTQSTNEALPGNKIEEFSRTPIEAIAILVDISGSMNELFFTQALKRIEIARVFFESFANKTIAYNFHHVISLYTFNESVSKISDFTENILKFCKSLKEIKCSGNTAIWDAMHKSMEDLVNLKTKYPEIKLRIICLSDGEDNRSKKIPYNVVQNLVEKKIVLDCVVFGTGCQMLKSISFGTGGYAFMCNIVDDGYKVFESDSFLSLKFRPSIDPSGLATETLFQSLSSKEFTSIPPPIKYPVQSDSKVENIKKTIMKVQASKPTFSSTITSLRFRRIMKELASLSKDPHPFISLYPCESDIEFWNGVITGSEGTPYAKGKFKIFIRFTEEYPEKAPEIRFITPIYHININSTGRICISILGYDYRSDLSIRYILDSIYGLLLVPESADTLDTNLANLFNHNRVQFDENAREWTRTKANRSEEELLNGVLDANKVDDVPDEFKCNASGKLMTDPVICSVSGYIYEREVIEKIIDQTGLDPISKSPAKKTDLTAILYLKKAIIDYRNLSK